MSKREWKFYIDDMISFANNVESYCEGLDQVTFEKNGLNYDATVRNIELIGEAATHISAEVRELYPNFPWRQVIATRNQLIHGYLGIDNDILWDIITENIPQLITELNEIKSSLDK